MGVIFPTPGLRQNLIQHIPLRKDREKFEHAVILAASAPQEIEVQIKIDSIKGRPVFFLQIFKVFKFYVIFAWQITPKALTRISLHDFRKKR